MDNGDAGNEVGDGRLKHVRVVTASGKRIEHGEVYLRHADDEFVVSPDDEFPPADTTRYPKADLLRVEVTQHHAGCFITTATAGEGPTLAALRGFRDDALARTPPGRALVGVYYRTSPPVARTLERHPDSRTARVVRRLVERCGGLARRRERSESGLARFVLSVLLTALYVLGMVVAVVGHGGIRAGETFGFGERP
jgi:hypothetical protein